MVVYRFISFRRRSKKFVFVFIGALLLYVCLVIPNPNIMATHYAMSGHFMTVLFSSYMLFLSFWFLLCSYVLLFFSPKGDKSAFRYVNRSDCASNIFDVNI